MISNREILYPVEEAGSKPGAVITAVKLFNRLLRVNADLFEPEKMKPSVMDYSSLLEC